MAGTPFVPLNYRLADADLNKLVARTAPAVLVVDDAMLSRIAPVDGIELVARSDFEAEFIARSEEHTSELQSLMRTSYAVFCLKKKNNKIYISLERNITFL